MIGRLVFRFFLCALCTAALCAIAIPARAKEYPAFGPLTIHNQNPIYLQTLGLEPTRATVLPVGSLEARVDLAYSNIFEQGQSAAHRLNLDMELMRLALHLAYGLRSDLELGLEVPFFHSGGGFLDAFIQDFHRFFHLPNGGRDRVPNNEYHYQFFSGGSLIYNIPSQSFMIGDIAVRIKHHFVDETAAVPGIAWFADFKLPSGSNGRGTGSDGFDFGMGLAMEKTWKRLHGYLNMQYILSGADNPLADYMRRTMFAFAAAVEVTLLDTWSIIAQLDGSTPLLTGTGMEAWDGVPMDLIIGFRGCESGLIGGHDLIWQAGFSEDVLSGGPSVDFTAFLSIGIRFHRPQTSSKKEQGLAKGIH